MIDIGLTKIALIGLVALVVIGPEKLPTVARMAGSLFGRAQRYINEVKSEVSREIELEELRKMQKEVQEAASDVEQSIAKGMSDTESSLNAAWSEAPDRRDDDTLFAPFKLDDADAQGQEFPQEEAGAQFGDSLLVQAPERPQGARDFRCRAGGALSTGQRQIAWQLLLMRSPSAVGGRFAYSRARARQHPAIPPSNLLFLSCPMTEEQKTTGAEDTFISHLVELRNRIMKASAAIIVIFLCLMPWAADIYDLLAHPMMAALPAGSKMIATGVITPFLIPVKVTLLVAFIVALPWVLYQMWAFVAPGLYAHEKRLVAPLVISSSLLFVGGVAFCYFLVFGVVFKFINNFAPHSISVAPDIDSYFGFVMTMFIAFGITFEVPVVVVVLVRMGLVTVEKLKQIRPYVIVGAFVVAAIVTPPDVMSQMLLAVPLCLLYEIGLLLAPLFVKVTQAPEETA